MSTLNRFSSIAMRVAIIINAIAGVGLIFYGCYVQNPPRSYAPVMFVFLGALNLFASSIGFWGSYNKKKLLTGFLVCGGLSALLQIGLTLSLLFAFDAIVQRIAKPSDPKYDKVSFQLNLARWVSLAFIFFELFSLIMAIILRFVVKPEQEYDPFNEANSAERESTLASLAKDITKAAKSTRNMSDKAYDKIRQKMLAKYGGQASDSADWRSKTKFSWDTS